MNVCVVCVCLGVSELIRYQRGAAADPGALNQGRSGPVRPATDDVY